MNSAMLGWALAAPLAGGLVGAVLWLASRVKRADPQVAFWLDALALVFACAGIVASPLLVLLAENGAALSLLELQLSVSPIATIVLPFVCAPLLVALFVAWGDNENEPEHGAHPLLLLLGVTLSASVVSAALLVGERLVQALLLFVLAAIASVVAVARTLKAPADIEDREARSLLSMRLSGGLKFVALAVAATVLLLVGTALIDRYALSMEKRDLLQLGLSLLAVGLFVRVGAMPFSAHASDLLRATPPVAMMALGGGVAATIGVGLLILAPAEGRLVGAQQTAWIAALAVLLAGVRAIGVSDFGLRVNDQRVRYAARLPVLVAMSVAAQAGWALFGVLSGSRAGATGAILLAANVAMALPLLAVSSQGSGAGGRGPASDAQQKVGHQTSGAGLAVGAASLLGLPPFGGFVGTLLVGQAAVSISGFWLAVMLLGTLLVALAWLRGGLAARASSAEEPASPQSKGFAGATPALLIVVLIAAQLGLFVLTGPVTDALANWTAAPWLSVP